MHLPNILDLHFVNFLLKILQSINNQNNCNIYQINSALTVKHISITDCIKKVFMLKKNVILTIQYI